MICEDQVSDTGPLGLLFTARTHSEYAGCSSLTPFLFDKGDFFNIRCLFSIIIIYFLNIAIKKIFGPKITKAFISKSCFDILSIEQN